MKRFLKNMIDGVVIAGAVLIAAALLWLGQLVIRSSVEVPEFALGFDGIDVAALIFAALYAAIKTALDVRRERREAQMINRLLDSAILEARARAQAIDAEPAGAGRARRRAMAQIAVVALEEKRAAMRSGKCKQNGGKENAGNSGKCETGMVGENPDR